jgi:hypothetical protein
MNVIVETRFEGDRASAATDRSSARIAIVTPAFRREAGSRQTDIGRRASHLPADTFKTAPALAPPLFHGRTVRPMPCCTSNDRRSRRCRIPHPSCASSYGAGTSGSAGATGAKVPGSRSCRRRTVRTLARTGDQDDHRARTRVRWILTCAPARSPPRGRGMSARGRPRAGSPPARRARAWLSRDPCSSARAHPA